MAGDGLLTADAAKLLDQLCAHAREGAPAEQLPVMDAIVRRLDGPLHVAIAGRVKSGKSTLVNALLGQRVARTDARECTRVVTWFRYGSAESVELVLRDGSRHRTRLDSEGLIPDDLGVPATEVAALEVRLSLACLRTFTLADTPGLASADRELSARTSEALGVDPDSQAAIASAEAVLFVMNQTVRESDIDVVRSFRAVARGGGCDAVSAIGVLNKADLFGGDDPMATGRRIAQRHADGLRGELATLVAYSGLFAEAARCGILTEADSAAVEELAGLDRELREVFLSSEKTFCERPCDVDSRTRARLWWTLRESGIRTCFDAIDRGATGASALAEHLYRCSGHGLVDLSLADLFEANASALKISAALEDLEALAWQVGGDWGARLRDELESARLDPATHVLAELSVLRKIRRGELDLPEELAADVAHLIAIQGSRPPDRAALARWQIYANTDAGPAEGAAARVIIRSYELASASGGGSPP